MTVNKVQVQKNFGQNAATYDQYAVVQKELAKELLTKVKRTGVCFQRILEIGCGTGFLTELLAREYPKALITAIDIAPEMIELAREKLADFSNINYFVVDGENLQIANIMSFGNPSFDLIISNAVFQWFADYATAFTQYHSLLELGGYLIFSTFGAGTFKELYVCLDFKKDPFMASQCLQAVLINSGFQSAGVEEVIKREYFDSCRTFFRFLKKTGAHNYLAEELSFQGIGTAIFNLIKRYDAMFHSDRGVPATYQCLYGWGQRIT